MIRAWVASFLLLAALAACDSGGTGNAPPAGNRMTATGKAAKAVPAAPLADKVRVRLVTAEGPILVELNGRRAPITAANFLAYVDRRRFDGTVFYRAARTRGAPGRGFIQGGIRHNYRLMLAPIAHEPTSRTGLRHVDGAISMARTAPGSAMGDFFITVGAMPSMDAHPGGTPDDQGFAAFGRVVEGMDVVRRILAAPTVAQRGSGAMTGQRIAEPVRILSVRRADEDEPGDEAQSGER
jgi:peptidyl-prolyl cis-trans isomerase A (cyclophilin A)